MAVESSVDSYINAQPEQAVDWNTFYNNYGREKYGSSWVDMDPDYWLTKVGNVFTGDVNIAKNKYDAYLRNLSDKNEFIAQQSARGYDKMMDDTKYQRMMKDFEKAGLNPYLIVNNGGISASASPSGAKASYTGYQKNQKSDNGNAGRNFALLLLAVAKIAAAFI